MTKIERLDIIFSQYIRKRDIGKGCISCGKFITYEQSECGHYISRRHKSTRFDENNCHAQCKTCNDFEDGNIKGYRQRLIQKIGLEKVEELERRKHQTVKISESELDDLIKLYTKRIKVM